MCQEFLIRVIRGRTKFCDSINFGSASESDASGDIILENLKTCYLIALLYYISLVIIVRTYLQKATGYVFIMMDYGLIVYNIVVIIEGRLTLLADKTQTIFHIEIQILSIHSSDR